MKLLKWSIFSSVHTMGWFIQFWAFVGYQRLPTLCFLCTEDQINWLYQNSFFLNVDTLCFNGLLCSQYNTFKSFWREHILVINFDFFLYSRQYSNILLLRITRLRLTWRWIENRLYITNAKGEKLHSLFFATLDRSSPITSLINSVQILFSKSGWNN